MKKIVDDELLIYKVCCLYYQDDMNQKEIADYLGISRSSVLRMLQTGKELGIVTIELHNPHFYDYGNMEKQLKDKFGFKDVVIVESSVLDTRLEATAYLFGKASDYLYDFFSEGDHIGVGMGRTLRNVAETTRTYDKVKDLMFVPMEGGISCGTSEIPDVQGNVIAKKFAEKFGGTYTQFLAPAVFSEKKVLDYFMREKAINYIQEEFNKINVVVMGIGIPERPGHTLLKADYISAGELRTIVENGAVGDMCLQFYDRDGNTGRYSFFNDRVAAMKLDRIRQVPSKIGIAGGAKKVDAVIGAVRGGYINILITDTECARLLLERRA